MAERTTLLRVDRRRRLAFGIEWLSPRGVVDMKRERRMEVKARRPSHVIVLRNGGTSRPLFGFGYGVPRGRSTYAAAALLGQYVPQGVAVLLWDLGSGRAALAAARDGVPVVGFDLIATHETVRLRLQELREQLGEHTRVRVLGRGTFIESVETLSAEQLLGGRDAGRARLAPASLPRGLIVSALTLLVLAGAGAYAWSAYTDYLAAQQARERAKHVDPNVAYARVLPGLLSGAGLRAERVTAMTDFARAIPVSTAGWWLTSVDCDSGSCRAGWSINGGTYDSFAATPVSGAQAVQFGQDFKSVTAMFPVTIPAQATGLTLPGLLTRQAFMQRIGTFQQLLNRGTTDKNALTRVTLTVGAPTVVGLPAGVREEQIRTPVRSGTWQMQGSAWMVRFPERFPPGFTVDHVHINIPQNNPEEAVIVIEGNYYVAN
ncbi:type 4b pilus protein PilO2 [Paraburkholderia unamae]|uniref:Pilin accessory protein (PilO) n=1 Tax=Paraburkholderia unamae TaxID=219649 RepID=A0ABX5KYD7_9BURK|nr:type 4b pilus protein PilO2 [Paraburkholderia unamae]PVX85832.1 pilin accessory protein (PilO) [Paraburkholderia unamae]